MGDQTCFLSRAPSNPRYTNVQRGAIEANPSPKTYESNFIHHDFVQFGKQHSDITLTAAPETGTFLAINRQSLELESCSIPLRIQHIFQLRSKKDLFALDLGFSGCDVTSVFLRFFGHLYPALGANPLKHLWLKFFLKLGQNPRL